VQRLGAREACEIGVEGGGGNEIEKDPSPFSSLALMGWRHPLVFITIIYYYLKRQPKIKDRNSKVLLT
jgi:hypothetical protein